jgi:hypothetical protein
MFFSGNTGGYILECLFAFRVIRKIASVSGARIYFNTLKICTF